MVTAPVSTGSVSTRSAERATENSCSGRCTRSKNRDTGRKASLTVMPVSWGSSTACRTGSETRVAKVSLGRISAGSRFEVANAAPVIMFVEPGPTDAVLAKVPSRRRIRA